MTAPRPRNAAPAIRGGKRPPQPHILNFTTLALLAEPVDAERDHVAGLEEFRLGFMPSPTPGGVPVMITSPGSITKYCEQHQTICRQSKIMVLVLPLALLAVDVEPHFEVCGSLSSSLVTSQGQRAEGFAALALGPLAGALDLEHRSETSFARQ